VAIESAGIVLAANDPRGVVAVLNLSRTSYRKMLQNLGWAVGYNLLAVPVAAGVLAWAGVTLAPAVGAVLMSLSTIVVALNAQLLRGLDLRQGRGASHHDRPGGDRHHHGRAGAGSTEPRHAP
jgi:Cu2+-exporting ATPase